VSDDALLGSFLLFFFAFFFQSFFRLSLLGFLGVSGFGHLGSPVMWLTLPMGGFNITTVTQYHFLPLNSKQKMNPIHLLKSIRQMIIEIS